MRKRVKVATKTRTPLSVLRAARRRLARPGVWAQGYRAYADDRDCAATALDAATASLNDCGSSRFKAAALLLDALRLPSWYQSLEISCWNDAHGRTLDQVLHAFDRAIKLAQQQAKQGKTR